MREIKFRGQRADNGEWVYGSLIQNVTDKGVNVAFIVPYLPCASEQHDMWTSEMFRVSPSTVGQYTGLKDNNGKEIYEGDIVRFDDSLYNSYAVEPYTGEVVMYKGYWSVKTNTLDWITDFIYAPLFKDDFADKKTESLGNIHDNSELLKTE